MALTFTTNVTDNVGVYSALTSVIQLDMAYAGSVWGAYIVANVNLEVQVNIQQTFSDTGDGTSATSVFLNSAGGFNYWRWGTIHEILTGNDPTGAGADIVINIDPDYINQWLYFDYAPSPVSPVPGNKVDAIEFFEHELGHALGISGYLDGAGNVIAPGNALSTFDAYISSAGGVPYFNGPNAMAVYGGPVPLTIDNFYHVGNTVGHPGSELLTDIMNGVVGPLGKSVGPSALDLAILADVGLPMAINHAPAIGSNGGGDTATVSVAENASSVTTVTGSDVDGGPLLYSIAGGADQARFQINAATGALSFVTAPNFEAHNSAANTNAYTVQVRVTDSGLPGLSDTQTITVNVTDVNEAPVSVTLANATASIAENSSTVTRTKVADIVVGDDALGTDVLALTGADQAFFEIIGTSLYLKAGVPLDFEGKNSFSVAVTVNDVAVGGTPDATSSTYTLAVANVNETPTIVSNGGGDTATVTINENTAAVTTVAASDPDAGAALSYSIVGGADQAKFQVNATTGALSFVTPPNFEANNSAAGNNGYVVQVRASDGALTDTQTITVNVADVNEAPFSVTLANASASIAENSSTATRVKVADIVVGDDALGTNVLALTGTDQSFFEIIGTSLYLKAGTVLDFESKTGYDVAVTVNDVAVGGSPDATSSTYTLAVTNVNEAPVIVSNGGGDTATVTINENTVNVATVGASDVDAGTVLAYSVVGGADQAKFQVNATTGALSFVTPPNFEANASAAGNNSYVVQVRASDGALADTQTITVNVADVNEAPASVTLANATVSIAENSSTATRVKVADIVVGDDALGTNALALTGADQAFFEIIGTSLYLKAGTVLDFEGKTGYDVAVTVDDATLGGAPDATGSTYTLAVGNVNEAPVITSNGGGATATLSINENGAAVTTVTASDVDAGTALSYSIVGGADQAKFQVNAATGTLSFLAPPNFEANNSAAGNNGYVVQVRASDGALADTQTITVNVADVNEAPTSVTLVNVAASIAENSSTATRVKVADIVVGDDALGTNVLALTGADQAFFEIIGTSLYLKAGTVLDFESKTGYDVAVTVNDVAVGGSPDATSSTYTLAVTNVNEAPVIVSNGGGDTATVTIAENTSGVATVGASDVDAGTALAYSIVGGADLAKFQINATTGALSFVAAPNFEANASAAGNNSYAVQVRASDGSLGDTQTITVNVTDVNEAPSSVTLVNTSAAISETNSTATRVKVADIVVGDDALGTNVLGLSGADQASFEIVGTSLYLRAGTVLNFEAKSSYAVAVTVDDASLGGAPDATSSTYTLPVVNANEAPVITSNGGGDTAIVTLGENTAGVTTVAASDVDVGNALTYSISGGADQAKFQINATTGALSFVSAPDFEAHASAANTNAYTVQVRVADNGLPSMSDTQTITVNVTDVNEAPASVTLANATAALAENGSTATHIKVADIAVADDALGTNVLALTGADQSFFEIVGTSLYLKAGTVLDFESKSSYAVAVTADDAAVGGAPDATSATYTLAVTNVNETPSIVSNGGGDTAIVTIDENTTGVATVGASDPDAGTALSYALVGGADQARFQVNATTGALSFVTAPDFEANGSAAGNKSYVVQVRASDGALADTQTITVNVANVNEAPSSVTLSNTTVSLAENGSTATHIKVADIAVADDALGTNVLALTGADQSFFEIVGTSLYLKAGTVLDFESKASYAVAVTADDASVGGAPDATSATYTLAVTNVNEAPVIGSNGGGASATVTIDENATAVTTVVASDPDAGSAIAYSIVGGVDQASFQIDSTSGALSFVAAPNFEANASAAASNSYVVQVRASDGALADTQTITVNVADVNETPVSVMLSNTAAPIAENSSTATRIKVADIAVADDGLGTNLLGLSGADRDFFEIAGSSLYLKAGTVLDFESKSSYAVAVTADDPALGGTPDVASSIYTLLVTDVNEGPVIVSDGGGGTATISMDENTNLVTTVAAEDPDAGALLGYAIVGGDDQAEFEIDATTGALSFIAPPDFTVPTDVDANNSYLVQVRVSDGTLTDTQSISVNVTEVVGGVFYGDGGDNAVTGTSASDTLYGVAGDDALFGGMGNDGLYGGDSNDTLYGGADNDALNGGAGGDVLDGGAGNDRLYGDMAEDTMYGGNGDDVIYGGADDDLLYGGSGNDEMLGDGGGNTLFGGLGEDLVEARDASDLFVEGVGQGTDRINVYLTSAYAVGDNVEQILARAAGGGTITGGATDNTMFGSAAADMLFGAAGNDRFYGGDGIDLLYGGADNDIFYGDAADDSLYGGAGNDFLYGGTGSNTAFGGAGDDYFEVRDAGDVFVEAAGEGTDWLGIYVSSVYVVGDNIELILGRSADGVTLTGGATDNTMTGTALTDVLSGGAGNDYLYGGDGADTLYGGADTDVLFGDAGDDTLYGGAGNDEMIGGAGADTAMGGLGNDVFEVRESGDLFIENAGEGIDRVNVYVSSAYTVGDNIEQIVGRADDGVTLTGGATDNTIAGTIQTDVLAGGGGDDFVYGNAGDDTLDGGLGDDLLSGGAGGDVFVFAARQGGSGTDTIADFGNGTDSVLVGSNTVDSGLGTATVLLHDGTVLVAGNGHLWLGGDFL